MRASAPVEAVGFLAAALEAGRRLGGIAGPPLGAVAQELGDAASLAARYEVGGLVFGLCGASSRTLAHRAGRGLRTVVLSARDGRGHCEGLDVCKKSGVRPSIPKEVA